MLSVRSKSLSAQAYERIIDGLLSGRWKQGEMINRRQVSEELKMSIAPVLEAMLQLDRDGFLETLPRRGTRVRKSSYRQLRDQIILREAIECEAARLNCPVLSRMDTSEFEALAQAIDNEPPGKAHVMMDMSFHRKLISLTQCASLLDVFDRVVRLGLFLGVDSFLPKASRPVASHVTLIRKLITRNPDQAEEAMRIHLRAGRETFYESSPIPEDNKAFEAFLEKYLH